jgi:hypothetical protein
MIMASKIKSSIYTSRCLTFQEFTEFCNIGFMELSNFITLNNKVISTHTKDIGYIHSWKLEFNDKGTSNLNIEINDQEFYFIESLLFLIENFFTPKSIFLNGYLDSYDSIFGTYICIKVVNNEIYFDYEKMKLLETIDPENPFDDSKNVNTMFNNLKI